MSNKTYTVGRIEESDSVASLQSYEEGNWIEYGDGQYGVIVGKLKGPVDWPKGEEETEEIGDAGEWVYIVGRESGGSKPFATDEITKADRDDVMGDDEEVPENPIEDIDEAEMSAVYYRISDPYDYDELQSGLEELINVPGVDDPGVGFDSWPDSWRKSEKPARLIALDAWSSMGGTWRGCMAEIGSRRLCSAFKDEILGTERWRNRF